MERPRTEEEEREYRRYLHRLKRRRERRRQIMIARAVVGTLGVLILLLMVGLIRMGVRAIRNDGSSDTKNQKQVEASVAPTEKVPDYSVPEGFEEYADKLEKMRKEYPQVDNILQNLYEYSESMLKMRSHMSFYGGSRIVEGYLQIAGCYCRV